MALGPIVTRPGLSKDKVIRPKDLSIWAGPHRVHGAWLQIHQNCARNILSARGLVVVDLDPLELQVGGALVIAGAVDAMLVRDDLPELKQIGGR